MKEPPLEKEKPTVQSGQIQTDSSDDLQQYRKRLALQASCVIHWRRQAHRLEAEYRRTRNPAHLKALHLHRAGIAVRMRSWGMEASV
jgi:hypothetical protein